MRYVFTGLLALLLTAGCSGSASKTDTSGGFDAVEVQDTGTDTAEVSDARHDAGDVLQDIGTGDVGQDMTNADTGTDAVDTVDVGQDTADADAIADAVDTGDVVQDPGTGDVAVNPDAWDWELPDAKAVYVNTQQPQPLVDTPYQIDTPLFYPIDGPGAAQNVLCLAEVDGSVYAGTGDGVYVLTGKKWVKSGDDTQAVSAIVKNPFGKGICTASDNQVSCADGDKTFSLAQDETVSSMAASNSQVWVVGTNGLYRWDGGQPGVVSGLKGQPRAVAILGDGHVIVVTDRGVQVNVDAQWVAVDASKLPDSDCSSVSTDGQNVVIGCKTGIARGRITVSQGKVSLDEWKTYKAGIGGLASDAIRAVSIHGDTITLAYGFGGGAITGDMAHQDYYVSLRWLPSNHVQAVLSASDNRRYYATDKGISIIYLATRTIAQKAEWTHKDLDEHFWRMDGFVSPEMYVHDDGTMHLTDSDNDGLWTQMMIGAFCYAYAVTKDPKYKQEARKAIHTMFLQVDIPAISFKARGMKRGFVARSLCRDDEECFADKKGQSNWHLVTYKGHQYYWKDDTSSDEIDGHFFGYPLYYDLCADTAQEKAEVADHALAIASYILDNGFRLIDLDGKETKWGHWQPDRLACAIDGLSKCIHDGYSLDWCVSSAHGGGWLNSLEILGTMLAAYHMSGDPKYFNAFKDLVLKYRYWKLAMGTDDTWTVTRPAVENHSDHELAILAYHTLLRYDPDPARRQWWLKSLRWFYEHEKPEHNPLWAGIFAMFAPGEADQAHAVQSLREMPVRDRREVLVDNSHRKDAKYIGIDRGKDKQIDRVYPFDEIRTMWWNGNPYEMIGGGNAHEVRGPMAFLLAYWSLRYSGILK